MAKAGIGWGWCLLSLAGAHSSMAQAVQPASEATKPESEQCRLTDADLARNAALSFHDFDQGDGAESNARSLSERGCFVEAARATEHYLVHGPILTPGQRDVVTWHLGQFLAVAGKEDKAALLMATTRHPSPEGEELDWNNYVAGTWAFLVKDSRLLDRSIVALRAAPPRNANNLAALERLARCFDRSYEQAYLGKGCSASAPVP